MKLSSALLTAALILAAPQAFSSERAQVGWQWIEQGALIIDVRTPQEFAQGHLNNAVNYPLSELDKHFADIDKEAHIVLYCRSGNRSGIAFEHLSAQGFSNLHNAGGLVEMQNAQ